MEGLRRTTMQRFVGRFVVLALLAATPALALCPHDCNRRGLCTGPGSDGYCFCEWGSTGEDCSIYICPSGDDPLTESQQPRAINITTSASSGMLQGNFKFTFQGESIELPADATLLDGSGCRAAIEQLPNIAKVECERHEVTEDHGAVYTVRIVGWPVGPHMNNIYYHDGNPPVSDFSCDTGADMTASAGAVRCVVTDAAADNIQEYLPCSNHGVCNKKTGKCACHHGFKGAACSENLDREDKLLGWAESPFFTGNVARVAAARNPSPDFRLWKVEAGGTDVATLRGDGRLSLHQGGLSIEHGGATVVGGGLTVSTNSKEAEAEAQLAAPSRREGVAVSVTSGDVDVLSGDVRISGPGGVDGRPGSGALDVSLSTPTPEAAVIKLRAPAAADPTVDSKRVSVTALAEADDAATSDATVAAKVKLLEATVGDVARFVVDATGRTTVHQGGLEVVEGGARVQSGGLLVDDGGATVGGGGLRVQSGGAAVDEGGLNVEQGDVHVRSGSATVSSAASMRDTLAVTAQSNDFGATVLQLDVPKASAVTAGGGDFSLLRASAGGSPRFEVSGAGKTVVHAGGLHVLSGGARVAAGGATVESGGIDVEGGVRIASGGLTLEGAGGFNVSEGGMHVASSGDAQAALSVSSRGAAFVGTAMRVDVTSAFAGAGEGGGGFRVFDARVAARDGAESGAGDDSTRSVFSVNGDGLVRAEGGIVAGEQSSGSDTPAAGVRSVGDLVAQSRAVLESVEVPAAETIVAPSTSSHVVITDDLAEAANRLSLQREGAVAGQLLLVHNADAQPTVDVVVPPGKAVLFVFSNGGTQASGEWRPLTATEFDARRLDGVTHLKAARDLDIGKHALAAGQLRATGQRSGHIAVFGAQGEIVGHSGLEYSLEQAASSADSAREGTATGAPGIPTLRVKRLGGFEAAGDIDMRGHRLKDVTIEGGTIHSVRELEVETLKIRRGMSKSELAVSSQTEGQLTFYGASGALTGDDALLFRDGVLHSAKMASFQAMGDIDMRGNASTSGHRLVGAELVNGTVRGAHLLEAKGVRIIGAQPGSLAVFGKDGVITAATAPNQQMGGAAPTSRSPTLHFDAAKGVLHVPALSASHVEGDVDFSGGQISNAVIVNGSATGLTTLETTSLKVTAQKNAAGRVALFGVNGEVAGSDAFTFADDTLVVPKLIFVEAAADVDFKGHKLRNAVIGPGSSIDGAKVVRAEQLVVTPKNDADKADMAGRIAVFGAGGSVELGPPGLRFAKATSKAGAKAKAADGTLHVPSIGAFEAMGDISMNGFRMSDVQITKGGIEGVSGLQAYDVDLVEGVIRDVEISAISVAIQGAKAGDLAVFGEKGKLTGGSGLRLDPKDGTVSISRLGAFTAAGDADFKGHEIKDAKLRGSKTTLVGAAALSARRVAVTLQKPGRLAVFGKGGEVEGSKSLTFKDGVLTVPKLAGHAVTGDVHFDGHSLKDATISGGTINDVTLAVAGQQAGGLAMYGENGKLTGHPALAFKDGTLYASRLSGFEVAGSVDMKRNKLSNAAIVDATIEGVDSLKVGSLAVEKQTSGHVAVFGAGGQLNGDPGLTFAAATLTVPKIGPFQAAGAIDFGAQKLSNVAIVSGTIEGIDSLKVRSLSIEKQPVGSVAVFGGAGGELVGDSGVSVASGVLQAPKLGAFQAQGPVDFNNQRMTNVAITGGTVQGVSSMKVKDLTVTSQTGRRVAIYGNDGTLSGDAGLTFRDGTLTAPQMGAFKAVGAVDFNKQAMTNVRIASGEVNGASLVAAKTLKATGDLEVGGDGAISGDLVVSGSVSGSGSFHDISDARFKRNVRSLRRDSQQLHDPSDDNTDDNTRAPDALRTLRSLRSVSFEFEEHEAFAFPNGTQFGFLAQEVERVLPQIVHDVQKPRMGAFKTVAYNQLVPWLVEGVNAQGRIIESLSDRVHRQEEELRLANAKIAELGAAQDQRMAKLEAQIAALTRATGNTQAQTS